MIGPCVTRATSTQSASNERADDGDERAEEDEHAQREREWNSQDHEQQRAEEEVDECDRERSRTSPGKFATNVTRPSTRG